MSNIDREREKWHEEKMKQQRELAKRRRDSYEKFELKSKVKDETTVESVSIDDEYERQVREEMLMNSGVGIDDEVTNDKELTDQEKWHKQMQASQADLAQKRRDSFAKFELKSKK